jgi:hypothetical protein
VLGGSHFAGNDRVDLPNPVTVEPGHSFSVLVTNPDGSAPMDAGNSLSVLRAYSADALPAATITAASLPQSVEAGTSVTVEALAFASE